MRRLRSAQISRTNQVPFVVSIPATASILTILFDVASRFHLREVTHILSLHKHTFLHPKLPSSKDRSAPCLRTSPSGLHVVHTMPQTFAQLTRELSKQASKSSIQDDLPVVLRPFPTIAIKAGDKLAKITGGRNVIEDRLLGAEHTILLDAPRKSHLLAVATKGQCLNIPTAIKSCGTCRILGRDPYYLVLAHTVWPTQPHNLFGRPRMSALCEPPKVGFGTQV